MKTLYIHIGTMKTGTTAIQHFCFYNEELLKKQGYCYPDFHELSQEATRRRNGRFLVNESGTKEEQRQLFRAGMEQIAELFSTYDNIILSDEGIWGATYKRRASLWKELRQEAQKHNYHVKIIVYLRRQDEYAVSCWKQMVKMGTVEGTWSWDKYVSQVPGGRQLDYYKKLESIGAILGKENIIVRPYERGKFEGGSIFTDFQKSTGLSMTEDYFIPENQVNLSLEGNMHEIKRVINTMGPLDDEKSRFFRSVLVDCSQDNEVQKNTSMFSEEENRLFLEKYEEGNRRIAEEYIGRTDEPLFDTSIKNMPKWTKDNEDMQDDIIRFVAAGFVSLLEENNKIREENKLLKEKLKHPARTVYRKIRGVESGERETL